MSYGLGSADAQSETAQAEAWIRSHQKGDPAAFGRLYKAYWKRLFGFVMRLGGGSPEDTEDWCQEIMTKVYKGLNQFRFESSFKGYLFAIAVNHIRSLRLLKSFRKEIPVGEVQLLEKILEPASGPESGAISNEIARAMNEAVTSLPEAERSVWLLHDADCSWKEIAEITGFNLRYAQLLREQAARFLSDKLREQGYGSKEGIS